MRLLIVSQYYMPETGASQVRLGALTRILVRLGHEVEVVTCMPNYPTGRIWPDYRGKIYCSETSDEGVRIHRVWVYASLGGGPKRLLNYGSFCALAPLALSRVQRPDCVLVESPPLSVAVLGILAATRWKTPVILNVADLWSDSAKELGLVRLGLALGAATRLEEWAYRRCTVINAVTVGVRRRLIERGIPAAKVILFPNGVDTEAFRPMNPDESLARELGVEGKTVVLCAGTMGFAHGLDVALRAMHLLQETAPNVVLILIGGGSEKNRLIEMARGLALRNVMFLDPRPLEYVSRLLSICLATLVTSRPLPILEDAIPAKIFPSLAAAKPVIFSGAGEAARLILEAQAGVVVPPANPIALKEAILSMTMDPQRCRLLGRHGREYVVSHLTWDGIVRSWLDQLVRNGIVGVQAASGWGGVGGCA